MIYLFENPDNLASIVYNGSTLTDEQKTQAVQIESLPVAKTPAGKVAVLKVKKATNAVWYDYMESPVDGQQALLQQSLSELTMYIAAQDEQIQLQNQAISELTMLIAETNGGNA